MAELTQFDARSAARIVRTVQAVEGATPPAKSLQFDPHFPQKQPNVFRVGSVTSSWQTNSSQVVTFINQTSTPNTVMASNLLYDVSTASGQTAVNVAIAKEGTGWYFVSGKQNGGGDVRLARFSGQWDFNASKSVTFVNNDGQGSSAEVQNVLRYIPEPEGANGQCVVAKDGTAWYLVHHQYGCQGGPGSLGAQDLAIDGYKDEATFETAQGGPKEAPQVLMQTFGCTKWVSLAKIQYVDGVGFDEAGNFIVTKRYMWALSDTSIPEVSFIDTTACES